MALGNLTPRDKFDQLLAFMRRTMRYWWLVGIITVIGGGLSVAFALRQERVYMAEAKVFYNERIRSNVKGNDFGLHTKNRGTSYSELVLARSNVTRIIEEHNLLPEIVAKHGVGAAVDEILQTKRIRFRVRGTNMFHLSYRSSDPEEAQAVVSMLVDILLEEDQRLRRESAETTVNFLHEEKAKVREELDKRELELTNFLAEHPELALNLGPGAVEPGASIVTMILQGAENTGDANPAVVDPRVFSLERKRSQLEAQLRLPEGAVPNTPKTPEQLAAEQLVKDAERELRAARADLKRKQERLTAAHPDMQAAQARVTDAERQLSDARARVPKVPKRAVRSHKQLENELQKIERQIADIQNRATRKRKPRGSNKAAARKLSQEDVKRDTELVRLSRAVQETRKRLDSLDSRLSNAEISASRHLADEGAVLSIVDPPNLPTLPQGKGRFFFVLAGTAAFGLFGTMLALALALVDDRLYGPDDVDKLALASMVVVIPKHRKPKRSRRGK